MDESASSSQSSEIPEMETIVIKPSDLEKLDIKNELKRAIQAQTKNDDPLEISQEDTTETSNDAKDSQDDEANDCDDTESDGQAEEDKDNKNEYKIDLDPNDEDASSTLLKNDNDIETDSQDHATNESSSDGSAKNTSIEGIKVDPTLQKTIKSKLCTLLNHTPLVMQVKNVDWPTADRKSPILLNSGVKGSITIEEITKKDVSKARLKIVSDEKSNLSATEIENMLNSGKLLKSGVKISPKQEEVQSTSKNSEDPAVLKKKCLKRIQAKMYENLKKVLEEVDSLPVKDKASLTFTPLVTSKGSEDEPKLYKSVSSGKPAEKKENKPCYMNTYRERKLSQGDSNDAKTSKSSDSDVVEIDSHPGSPAAHVVKQFGKTKTAIRSALIVSNDSIEIDLDEERVVKVVPKKRGRPPKRLSNVENKSDSDEDYVVNEKRPFKKTIVKRYVQSGGSSQQGDSPQVTPRKRGRPRKNPETPQTETQKSQLEDSNDSQSKDDSNKSKDDSKDESNKSKEEEQQPESSSTKSNTVEPGETPKRKRGRPPKNRNVENAETTPVVKEVKPPEVKVPKKRGRKSKAELEALRKEAEKSGTVAKKEEEREKIPQRYTQSKISGRKRKIINYSLLNGDDSDSEEEDEDDEEGEDEEEEFEVIVKTVGRPRKRAKAESTEEDEEDEEEEEEAEEDDEQDNSSQDEYGSSKKNNKRTRADDAHEGESPKAKQPKQANSDEKTDKNGNTKNEKIEIKQNANAKQSNNETQKSDEKQTMVEKQKTIETQKPIDKQNNDEIIKENENAKSENNSAKPEVPVDKSVVKETIAPAKEEQKVVESENVEENQKSTTDPSDVIECPVCSVKVEKSLWSEHKAQAHSDLTSDEKAVVQVDSTVVKSLK